MPSLHGEIGVCGIPEKQETLPLTCPTDASFTGRHLSAEVDPAHPRPPFSCEMMQTWKPTLPSATVSDFPGLQHVGGGKGEVLSSQERVNKFDS